MSVLDARSSLASMSSRRSRPTFRLATLTALCCTMACDGGDDLSEREEAIIARWFDCDECTAGELDSVVHLRDRAVVRLAQGLRGPRQDALLAARRQAQATYTADSILSSERYVALLLENFVGRYQMRAAIGLEAVGTAGAIQALREARDSAAAWGHRTDVARTVEAAIVSLSFARFTGTLSDTSVRFGSRVVVQPDTLTWDGSESVVLSGQPFGDSLVVHADSDSIVFLAVGEWGNHTVQLTGQGPDDDTLIAPLNIISLRYDPRSPATAPIITATELPQRRYLVLGARRIDTVDHFRFQPVVPLALTASAEVPGFVAPSLQWHLCTSPMLAPIGPRSRLAGRVQDERGTAVESASVHMTGTSARNVTDVDGRFALVNYPPMATRTGFATLNIQKQGFRTREVRVQAGADSIIVSLTTDSASARSAVSREASSVRIAGDSCRVLRVSVPGSGGARIIRLRLTSP